MEQTDGKVQNEFSKQNEFFEQNDVPEQTEFVEEFVSGGKTYTICAKNTLQEYDGGDVDGFIYNLTLTNDEGTVLQQFSFGALDEYVDFYFDDLNFDGYPDLEINYFHWGKSNINPYYLYLWEPAQEKYCEEAIDIPTNYEVDKDKKVFLTWSGDLVELGYHANRINTEGKVVELRSFHLTMNTQFVRIIDCVSGEILFEGTFEFGEDGELLNREYYESVFWSGL